ncbi:MAG: hypothetical protein JXB03_04135 [Spirochaetales bacterium]|nr:hypothetical protein [Spirochaetales bacterium]
MYSDKSAEKRWFEEALAAVAVSAQRAPSAETTRDLLRLSRLSGSLYIPYQLVQRACAHNELEDFTRLTAAAHSSGAAGEFFSAYVHMNGHIRLPAVTGLILTFLKTCTDSQISVTLRKKIFSHTFHSVNHLNNPAVTVSVEFTLILFTRLARYVPGVLEQVQSFHGLLRAKYPQGTAERWLSRGMSLLVPGKQEEAALFFKLQSAESRSLLGMKSAVLDELKNSLTIFAASIAGEPAGIFSNENSFTGSRRPFTDGANMYLPPTVTFFEDTAQNDRAYTVLTAQQCGLIKYKSYCISIDEMDRLYPGLFDEIRERFALVLPDIMAQVRNRYAKHVTGIRERTTGEIEIVTKDKRTIVLLATPHEKLFFMFPHPYLIKELFSLLESTRVSFLIGCEYPGLRRDIAAVSQALWTRLPALEYNPRRISSVGEAAIQMLGHIALHNEGKIPLRQGTIEKTETFYRKIFDRVRKLDATVYSSLAAAVEVYFYLHDTFPLDTILDSARPHQFLDFPGLADIYPEAVANNKPEYFGEEFSLTKKDRIATGSEQEIDLTALSTRNSDTRLLEEYLHRGKTKVFSYPEYDVHAGSYRKNHTTVLERTMSEGEGNRAMRILAAYQKTYKSVKKRFLMLKPEEVEISRKWVYGEELHIDDCLDYFTQIRRRETPDDKVYQNKIINRRDICAAVLLDASSSTASTIPAGAVIDIELSAMVLLGHALHFLGDAFGLYSFNSRGRRQVFLNAIKHFQEPWNIGIMSRLDSIAPAYSNRDGAAVRHVTRLLAGEPNKTKLLLILSDGIPADPGYGAKQGDSVTDYGIEDTRKAVIEARKAGIFPYCITIDREAKDYIGHIYGKYGHTIVPRIEDLPQRLSKLYQKLTR